MIIMKYRIYNHAGDYVSPSFILTTYHVVGSTTIAFETDEEESYYLDISVIHDSSFILNDSPAVKREFIYETRMSYDVYNNDEEYEETFVLSGSKIYITEPGVYLVGLWRMGRHVTPNIMIIVWDDASLVPIPPDEPVIPQELELNMPNLELPAGDNAKLTVNNIPDAAADKKLLWSSSDETVADVDDDGVVSGISEGSAVISVITEDGAYAAECSVSVVMPVSDISPDDEAGALTTALPDGAAGDETPDNPPGMEAATETIDPAIMLAPNDAPERNPLYVYLIFGVIAVLVAFAVVLIIKKRKMK